MTTEEIASICHEANRAYCRVFGDDSQLPWSEAPDWQRESAIDGVKFHIENPDAGPSRSHENWLKVKKDGGWVYGETKDPDRKTHPCMVPYKDLPEDQQRKDDLFVAIVTALRAGYLDDLE